MPLQPTPSQDLLVDPVRETLAALERWVSTDVSTSGAEVAVRLTPFLRERVSLRGEAGAVHHLCGRTAEVARWAGDVSAVESRERLAQCIAAEAADHASAIAGVAGMSRAALGRTPWIAAIGASPLLHDCFVAAGASGREPRAIVAELRPSLEGRRLAAHIARNGIPVWLVIDAALSMLLTQTATLWVDAAAVTERGAIVPIGAFATALAARDAGVPVHLLATRRAFLPSGSPGLSIDEAEPDAVWADPPQGVRARNVKHELMPLELARGVVVEDGVLAAGEAAQLARERAVPALPGGVAS